MKTNNKISAYILRGSTAALLFSCVIVALCSAINLPHHPPKALPPQDNTAFGANAHQSRTLSFADRVAYQSAIEDVYWRHRIWPDTNAGPKPSLDAVMSQAQIEKKVEDYLRNSQALEDYWQRPITADQLQTEMERMASHTKQPEVLRELFEALGNDPFVIAECLARPVLAERFANGDPVAAGVSPASTKLFAADTAASTENRFRATNRGVTSYTLPVIASPSGSSCLDDTWRATSTTNAPTARFGHPAVWTGIVSVLIGTGTGSFGAASNFTAGTAPIFVAVGDFNGDGVQDLATANNNSDNVSVLIGTGTGSFGPPSNFPVGATPYSVAVGDFNGDGVQDLAAANSGSNNVSVLLRTCPATPTPTPSPTPTATATATASSTPRSQPTPRPRPTPVPRP